MNICFLHSGFGKIGGIERVVDILIKNFALNKNYNIFSLGFLNDSKCEHIDNISFSNLYVKKTSMTRAIIFKFAIVKLIKYLKNNDIDIIIACGVLYYPLAVISAKLAHVKSICWEHTNPNINCDYKFQNLCRKFGMKFSDQNVCISLEGYKYYCNIVKNKNLLIHNPLDPRIYASLNTYSDNSKKIISVGRLTKVKNFSVIMEIVEDIKDFFENNGITWDIYGDGEEYEKLNKLIVEKKLEKYIKLMGNVTNIYDVYKDYMFIVMTSLYEGFPMVLIEASANGLPMISFDVETGPNEIIKSGINGFIIPLNDLKEMENKIKYLVNNKQARVNMSKNSRNTSSNYDIKNICDDWYKLFARLVNEK